MEKEIAEKIIEKLGKITESTGKTVKFSSEKYSPVSFSKENFHDINECKGQIAFIDGGNNAIFESSRFSLHFCRVYYTIYNDNKRVKFAKKEFYVLASSNFNAIELEVFGIDFKVKEINLFDKTLAKGTHRVRVSEAANACRKLSELYFASELVDELDPSSVIVLDRDLEASMTGEKELFDKLFLKAKEKNVVVCGIAKTSRLFTETGDSALGAVILIAPEGAWAYYPIVKIENDLHRVEMCFVKLHPQSKYVFRFEIFNLQKDRIDSVLGMLRVNSKDPVFLGYPYGLIEADKMARVSNDDAEYLKVKLTSKAGSKRDKIIEYMKTVDAHSVLDNIS